VLSDANVDQAVNAAMFGKFVHQGQVCMSINRFIVHEEKYDEFLEKFTTRTKQLSYGDPLDPKTVIGPLINKTQLERAKSNLQLAKESGAKTVLDAKINGNVMAPA